jgi:glycosyltransferase involved in cell wall biosynthesis
MVATVAQMKKPPLISVVIPFFNTNTGFMAEAIASVLAQTYPHWELLLINDGSDAPSRAVAEEFAQHHPHKIRCLSHANGENRGISASRQLGLTMAQGKYVAILDADDVWLPHKLMEQVAIMEAYPAVGMLYGNTLYWHSWQGQGVGGDYMPALNLPPNQIISPPQLMPLFLQGKVAVPCTCSVLLRRESLLALGGFELEFGGMYEDQVLYSKMCLHTPTYVSDACWDYYRQHPDSMCSVISQAAQTVARQRFLDWLTTYLHQYELKDQGVWQALEKEKWLLKNPKWRRLQKWSARLTNTFFK